MDDRSVGNLFTILSGRPSANLFAEQCKSEIINLFPLAIPQYPVELIPAIRRIGDSGVDPIGYDGTGIINRLAQLEKPSAENQGDKDKFEAINDFLRDVTDRPDAKIEIPYARDTILVHMDNKVLPISCLGTGLHEVIILAAAATTLSNQIVCIEEPELHLNPVLQKKFIRHLSERTDNQYFITTHSAAIMDTVGAEVYHVTLVNGKSRVDRVTTDSTRMVVLEDLGYHPSDLLLANCIIWVEGPSDRLYINWWLHELEPSFVEGIHFSVMFYGGRLAAHVSNAEEGPAVEEFIHLRRLNQRGAILIDSDRCEESDGINDTKQRLREEFDKGPGFAWITNGREIENYLPVEIISQAVSETHPSATRLSGDDRFANLLNITTQSGNESKASKVKVAKWITRNQAPDCEVLDLRQKLQKLVDFIRDSNPVGSIAT